MCQLRNLLADCLAKSSSLLSLRRGFRCEADVLLWERRREHLKQVRSAVAVCMR